MLGILCSSILMVPSPFLKTSKMAADLKLELSVPFISPEEALIACKALSVDPEPKRGGTKKQLTVTGNVLNVTLEASEARTLRVSSNSFLDHLTLVTKTIEQFGPPLPEPITS